MLALRVRRVGIVIDRLVRCCLAAAGVGLFALAPSVGAAPVPEPSNDGVTTQPGLLDVPVGCAVPDPADVAFIGTAVAKDFEKVRYEIVQLRAGSISGYSIDGLVDVLYLDDAKFVNLRRELPRRCTFRSRLRRALLDDPAGRAPVWRQRRDRLGRHRCRVSGDRRPCAHRAP